MTKSDISDIADDILIRLIDIPEYSDIGDVGNAIGMVVAKYKDFDKESFIHGIKHGISLVDGTHD